MQPQLTKNKQEIILEEKYKKTIENKRFLLYDSEDKKRILIFMSDIQLQILSSSVIWHIDGTFYTSPKGNLFKFIKLFYK